MDREQQERFERAVEEKKAEAQARSRQHGRANPDDPGEITEQQAARSRTTDTQDEASARERSSRHGHVTADKWNQ